ncbi:MAG: HAMP domain-containing histidine kinase [Clostridia bacterium]|jgi:signal transduction histidine kinase|nr:HAMP domain-containing histidine kinase [Clostridia bacterium]
MVKRLKRKFVMTSMLSLLAVLVFLSCTINFLFDLQVNKGADVILTLISENNGKFPEFEPNMEVKLKNHEINVQGKNDGTINVNMKNSNSNINITAETKFETRYFTLFTDKNGDVSQMDLTSVAAIDREKAESYAKAVLNSGKESGIFKYYRFMITDTDNGKMIVFLDCHDRISTKKQVMALSLVVGALCLAIMFVIVSLVSGKVVKQTAEAIESQKQFITDASHEIKTPLAIISANADVLELEHGRSEWLDSIRNQTTRLGELVKVLLTLSKMSEEQSVVFREFNLSKAATEAFEPFYVLANSKGKKTQTDIQEGIMYNGDEEYIKQMVSILADNAVKYASENGTIKLTLKKTALNKIELSVFNTCDPMSQEQLYRLFDRFYRADSSRNRATGGYGIGLSIAKAIVEKHRGTIKAENIDGGVIFTAKL